MSTMSLDRKLHWLQHPLFVVLSCTGALVEHVELSLHLPVQAQSLVPPRVQTCGGSYIKGAVEASLYITHCSPTV